MDQRKQTNVCKITEDVSTESVPFALICNLMFSKARGKFRVGLFSWIEEYDKFRGNFFSQICLKRGESTNSIKPKSNPSFLAQFRSSH